MRWQWSLPEKVEIEGFRHLGNIKPQRERESQERLRDGDWKICTKGSHHYAGLQFIELHCPRFCLTWTKLLRAEQMQRTAEGKSVTTVPGFQFCKHARFLTLRADQGMFVHYGILWALRFPCASWSLFFGSMLTQRWKSFGWWVQCQSQRSDSMSIPLKLAAICFES